jgi:hypothetical protein
VDEPPSSLQILDLFLFTLHLPSILVFLNLLLSFFRPAYLHLPHNQSLYHCITCKFTTIFSSIKTPTWIRL